VLELAEEIRSGRCRPFFKEIPRSGSQIQVTELTIGTKGFDERREKIIVKSHHHESKWKSAERAYHIIEEIAAHGFSGGRFRVPKPLGSDRESRTLIEEGVRGKSLHDRLIRADAESARHYLRLAAQWLARLHKCALQVTPPREFIALEKSRVQRYLDKFTDIGHRQTRRAREILVGVLEAESRLYAGQEHKLVQGHGDFHLKNILIGQSNPDDRNSTFVAVIDFDSSYCLPPAFDVGTFLSQYRNQLFDNEEVRRKAPEKIFLDTYLAYTGWNNRGFLSEVELFKALVNVAMRDAQLSKAADVTGSSG
jgi:aminoglycoside phosphotransferase (APT) family kinase protein